MGHHHGHHHHPEPEDGDTSSDRYRETKRVTLVGAGINLFLSIIKIVFGTISQSQSLIADGIHSLSDLISDAMVLFAAKHSSQEADENHPYGHGRIETLITVGLGLFLIAVAGGIGVDAIRRMLEPDDLMHPGYMALVVAVISIGANEFLFQYTLRVANRFNSNMLRANAWHHRSDAISSVIVLLGVGGTMIGWQYLDAVAAIGVSLMIAKIGWDVCISSIRELVDTGLEPERIETINETIQAINGVQELHMLRTRRMGGQALVDVHIQVSPELSVSEGHYISEKVRAELIAQDKEISDVMVHIDPEDDEKSAVSAHLPPRNEVEALLHERWSNIEHAALVKKIVLHYLDGKIHVEVSLPLAKSGSAEQASAIAQELTEAGTGGYIAGVQVTFYQASAI